jgi:nitronate monooxygenase
MRKTVEKFCERLGLRVPILLAPMAGVPAPALSAGLAAAGGLGACGVLLMKPAEIEQWSQAFRATGSNAFQLNNWIPDPPPVRDERHETAVRAFLGQWGPAVPPEAANATPPDFQAQCQAMLDAQPRAISSIMGLYPPDMVSEMKKRGIAWLANATTVAEARTAEQAGADFIVAQGMEAGGHRGVFDNRNAEAQAVGTFALLPAIVDSVSIPVVATGGIADARGIAAALMLGASAVQIGTGFLRCPEAQMPAAWADALERTMPEDTILTRAFSGRAGRALATDYVRAAAAPGTPVPAPYPVQRGLTAAMRKKAVAAGDLQRMQAWAGQSARLARKEPVGERVTRLWREAGELLGGN